jgi:hypothetical protein
MLTIDRRSMLAGLLASGIPLPAFAAVPRNDPEWVRALLVTLHPGLLRYQTQAEFDARYADFARDWMRRPTFEARYLGLSRLLGAIRCGHSYVNPYNQRAAIVATLTEGRRLLPFRFRWIGRQMVVTGDPHRTGLPLGSVIASIDGTPSATILDALMPFARADGGNDGKRRALMAVSGTDAFEAFDLFHPLLFKTGTSVRIAGTDPKGRRLARTLVTVNRTARLATRQPDPPKGDDRPTWTFERRGRSAVLTMPSWALYDSNWNWRAWLDTRFADMARNRVTGLVVDLRDNEGGEDCGDEIIARLIDEPLAADPMRRLVRFRSVPDDLRPPLDTWDPSFVELGKDAAPFDKRFLELPPSDSGGSNVIAPKARFRGRVAVLISATNSSATFGFAQRVKDARLATLVGETTGGNRRGINGGAYFFARLPDSGIEFDIPLIGTFPDGPRPDAGIEPDVRVPVTAAAIAAGRDEALDRALALVGRAS